jgi:hypothetical protein
MLMAIDEVYYANVGDALDKTLREEEQAGDATPLDIRKARIIIFSDHHKGARNGADDFLACERAYNAALAYYYRMGYTLYALGDVEELWEERPPTVLKTYRRSLDLEARFHRDGRYQRFFGNHDDIWQFEDAVKNHLDPIFGGEPLKVRESLLFQLMDGDRPLCKLFLVHGHQGTLDSEKFADFSRIIVRHVWRPIQRFFNLRTNTPAEDWELRRGHNNALYQWSEKQKNLVMIAGHTHRPVFKSLTHAAQIEKEIAAKTAELETDRGNEKLQENLSELEAELEWVMAQQKQASGVEESNLQVKPSYFNTGCCSFLDGDITGLEILGGQIHLVRWPNEDGEPKRDVLESESLVTVFEAL